MTNYDAFIRVTDHQVYTSPVWNVVEFTPEQRSSILAVQMTAADWEKEFKLMETGGLPEWLEQIKSQGSEETSSVTEQESVQLLSPVGAKAKQGIFKIVPSFSFDSVDSEGTEKEGDEEVNTQDRLIKVESKLGKLKAKLGRPFMDIDASYSVMVSDLQKLHERVKTLSIMIGPLPVNAKSPNANLSRIIQTTSDKVQDFDEFKRQITANYKNLFEDFELHKRSVNTLHEEFAEMQDLPSQLDQWMHATNLTFEAFNKRFASIKLVLNRVTPDFGNNKENMPTLLSGKNSEDALTSDLLYHRVLDLEEKIKILESRVVGAGVQLGGLVFQSFEDLYAWVKIKIPKGRFGLFVDGHSFLEFFSLSGHIDTESGAAAFSHSQRAGFSTYIKAQLAISFKNLFPVVFGKGGSPSMDDSECLPAISTGDKWNNGSTGIHHQLMRNMNDVSYKLNSSIRKVLKDHPEARQLATDCVTSAKRFVIDLIAFMSQEYSTWQQRGFSKKDAWLVVSQIVRRIFEDLQSARISARNAQDFDDTDFTTATFLYATLRCHEVMEGYVRHRFHAHPHVSSVITRHLAANFVKPDSSSDAKISTLESKVKTFGTKLDSYVSKLEHLISKEKDRKGKGDRDKEKDKGDKVKNGRGRLDSD